METRFTKDGGWVPYSGRQRKVSPLEQATAPKGVDVSTLRAQRKTEEVIGELKPGQAEKIVHEHAVSLIHSSMSLRLLHSTAVSGILNKVLHRFQTHRADSEFRAEFKEAFLKVVLNDSDGQCQIGQRLRKAYRSLVGECFREAHQSPALFASMLSVMETVRDQLPKSGRHDSGKTMHVGADFHGEVTAKIILSTENLRNSQLDRNDIARALVLLGFPKESVDKVVNEAYTNLDR